MNRQLTATPLADWKIYLRWHLIHAAAPILSDAFVQENFNFYGKRLSGTKEMQPRWKRCVNRRSMAVGRSARPALRRKVFSARRQRARCTRWCTTSSPPARRYRHACLDGPGNKKGRHRQSSKPSPSRSATRANGAITPRLKSSATSYAEQRLHAATFENSRASSPRSANPSTATSGA